jgi:hypothetical protein
VEVEIITAEVIATTTPAIVEVEIITAEVIATTTPAIIVMVKRVVQSKIAKILMMFK